MVKKYYEFVPKSEYSEYLHLSEKLVRLLVKNLNAKCINSKYYIIGSAGKRNLVTRLVIGEERQPIDVDINLEIDLFSLYKNYRRLDFLKEFIRNELNRIIKESNKSFSDGQNSSSVLTYILSNDKDQIAFSFDIAIVSRNKNNELQRLKFAKKSNSYTWTVVFDSSNLEEKVRLIKTKEDWNKLRTTYLKLKNKYIGDENHPSYVCYKMAVEEIYNQICKEEDLDYNAEEQKKFYCPFCGAEKEYEDEICSVCNDDDD